LFADDHEDVLRTPGGELESEFEIVNKAANGEEAIDALGQLKTPQ
jgi:CheY-like chemotaxis protein